MAESGDNNSVKDADADNVRHVRFSLDRNQTFEFKTGMDDDNTAGEIHKTEVEKAQQELEECRNMFRQEVERLQLELEEFKEQCEQKKQELEKDVEDEKEKADQQIDDLQKKRDVVEESLQEELAKQTEYMEKKQVRLDQEQELLETEEELNERQENLEVFKHELDEIEKYLKRREDMCKNKEEELKELDEDLNDLKKELDTEQQILEDEGVDIKERKQIAKKNWHIVKTNMDELNREKILEKALKKCESDVERAKTITEERESEINRLKSQIKELEFQSDKKDQKIRQLETHLSISLSSGAPAIKPRRLSMINPTSASTMSVSPLPRIEIQDEDQSTSSSSSSDQKLSLSSPVSGSRSHKKVAEGSSLWKRGGSLKTDHEIRRSKSVLEEDDSMRQSVAERGRRFTIASSSSNEVLTPQLHFTQQHYRGQGHNSPTRGHERDDLTKIEYDKRVTSGTCTVQ